MTFQWELIQCRFKLLASFVILTVLEFWRKTTKNLKKGCLVQSRHDKNIYKKLRGRIRFELNLNCLPLTFRLYSFIHVDDKHVVRKLSNFNTYFKLKKKRKAKTTHLIPTGLMLVLILCSSILFPAHWARGSICGKLDCYFK